MTYIYILERNEIPFYVGKAKDFIRRKGKHKELYGKDIIMTIIDSCGDEYECWKPLEKFWISYIKFLGFELTNKNNGGGGPSKYTEESKIKMRKPRKEGTGAKISKTLLKNNHSKYYTDDVKQKMSNGMTGLKRGPISEETRIKIKEGLKDHSKHYTPEICQKMRIALKGSHGGPLSEEHIIKMKEGRRKKSKRVFQYDLNGKFIKEWSGKGEISDWVKENEERARTQNVISQINDCCIGKIISCWGYIWRFKDEFIPVIPLKESF